MPVYLGAKPVLYAEQPIMLSAWRHPSNAFDHIGKLHLKHFQETHNLLFGRISGYL